MGSAEKSSSMQEHQQHQRSDPTDPDLWLLRGKLSVWGDPPPRWLVPGYFTFEDSDEPVLVDPPIAVVTSLLRNQLRMAQHDCRARIISFDQIDLTALLKHQAGILTAWGCGGAWSHGAQLFKPACSEVEVAWLTHQGRRAVRLRVRRHLRRHDPSKYSPRWVADLADPAEAEKAWDAVLPGRAQWLDDRRSALTRRRLRTFGPRGNDDRRSLWDLSLSHSRPEQERSWSIACSDPGWFR